MEEDGDQLTIINAFSSFPTFFIKEADTGDDLRQFNELSLFVSLD